MDTTHVIIFPVSDPGALRLYSNTSILAELAGENSIPWAGSPAFGKHPRTAELSAQARDRLMDGAFEFTIEGVTFVRRSVR